MRLISACLISLFFTFVIIAFPISISAHTIYDFPEVTDGQINEALQKIVPLRFLPSQPLYFLITVKELFSRFFQPSAVEKSRFDLIASGKRLKESYLLLGQNNTKLASNNLIRYGNRINIMLIQLEKANSQNQDIAKLVGEIGESLQNHETLFIAINSKLHVTEDSYQFDENYANALINFKEAIQTINKFQPGIKNRFELIHESEASQPVTIEKLTPDQLPEAIESTQKAKPKRIIY